MTDIVGKYIIANDNANEFATDAVKAIYPKALEDIDGLMTNSRERDEELWEDLDADGEATTNDFDSTPTDDRGIDWSIGLASVSAAATIQFFLSQRQKLIIEPSAYYAQKMGPFNLTRAQLIQAGRRDAVFVADETYEKIKSEYLKKFDAIKKMSNTQLYNNLVEARAMRPIDDQVMDAMGYVSRMTNYPPNSPQYKQAVADLVDRNSKRGLQGMTRRSVEGISVVAESNGDMQTLMVWILERSPGNCRYCPDRAGEVKTLAEWEEDGLPGAAVCQGGDYCHCHLASFSE